MQIQQLQHGNRNKKIQQEKNARQNARQKYKTKIQHEKEQHKTLISFAFSLYLPLVHTTHL